MSDLYKNRCITPDSKRLLHNLIFLEESLSKYCADEMNNYFLTEILGTDPIHIEYNRRIALAKRKLDFQLDEVDNADCTSSD